MRRLEGQVAIVTGGGTGIGRETARMLAAEGAQVVIAGRRKEPLDEVVADIERAGGRAAARQADLTKLDEAAGLAAWTLATFGRVDVLVNNAGFSSRVRNIQWVPKDDWLGVFDVNVHGVYALTQAVLPGMVERGSGTIVTVSSVAALKPGLIGGAPYGAAKAAVNNMMGHLRAVLRDRGIRACTVMPAEVDTPILDKRPRPPTDADRASMMKPEDIAAAILLCVTLPARTMIEEMVVAPTRTRDQSQDLAVSRDLGRPGPARPA